MEGRPLFHEGTLSTLNLRTFSRISIFFRNFERPFTPRGWLRSASNFGKTRFRRSPTFHLSTSKNLFWRKFLSDGPEVEDKGPWGWRTKAQGIDSVFGPPWREEFKEGGKLNSHTPDHKGSVDSNSHANKLLPRHG